MEVHQRRSECPTRAHRRPRRRRPHPRRITGPYEYVTEIPCQTTKPGSLLKSQIPVRTWADWDDARPGFVEIDLVGHDGGNPAGPHAFTLTVTDIATGWTEHRSVPDKTGKCVLAALNDIAAKMPFPILGVDSDNGSEFINDHLWRWCQRRKITFTRA